MPVSLPSDEGILDESLHQRCLWWELSWAGSQPEVLHWCYGELNLNLQDPQLGLSYKTISQPALDCSLHLAESLRVWRRLDLGSGRESVACWMPGGILVLQIPLASARCRAETRPQASRFPVHLLTFAIRTLLIFAAEDPTVQLNWCDWKQGGGRTGY